MDIVWEDLTITVGEKVVVRRMSGTARELVAPHIAFISLSVAEHFSSVSTPGFLLVYGAVD
jgi:hypothetical protein